jgi:hypothetical protein
VDEVKWHPIEADLEHGIYLDHGVAYVLPALEAAPSWVRRVGSFGIGANLRWSSFSIGFDVLRHGVLVQVGPAYLWIAHIKRQLDHYTARKTGEGK